MQSSTEQHIKDRHCDRGDPFAHAEGDGVALKARGAQRQRAGDKMEGVAHAKHDRHQSEELEL